MGTEISKRYFFDILVLVSIFLAVYLLKGFLGSLFIAALLAYMLRPFHKFLLKRFKYEKLVSLTIGLLSLLIIVGFLALLVPQLIVQISDVFASAEVVIRQQVEYITVCTDLDNTLQCKATTQLLEFVDKVKLEEGSIELTKAASGFILGILKALIDNVPIIFINLIIIVAGVFYFLENGGDLRNSFYKMLPLKQKHKRRIFKRVEEVSYGVFIGNFATALMEGFLGWLLFMIFGIPAPIVWGFLMGLLAFIPIIGATIIWVPAVIIFIVKGLFLKGILLGLLCLLFIGGIDIFVKPMLIGDRIRMHSFLVLLSVIAGLSVFGLLGLFFGPIILSFMITLLEIFSDEK